MRRLVAGLIRLYQKTLSLDHGPLKRFVKQPTCKFFPTCSEYARVSLLRFGIWKGGRVALHRLGRCHPWSEGGVDEVPEASRLQP